MTYRDLHIGQRFTFVPGGSVCVKMGEDLYAGPSGYLMMIGNVSIKVTSI